MTKKLILAGLLLLSSCGYSQQNSEAMGQVKKVIHRTPIICPNYYEVDLSLGVMRNGVGSVSTQDMWAYVEDPAVLKVLQEAGKTGEPLVKVEYDERRIALCTEEKIITKAEVVK